MEIESKIGQPTISKILAATFESIAKNCQFALPTPTIEGNKTKAEEFNEMWQFPNVVGAIDGKHIRIVAPDNSGSRYFNYKSFFSIVLLAIVDAKYKFSNIIVGSFGREGDAGEQFDLSNNLISHSAIFFNIGIFLHSELGKAIRDGSYPFPAPQKLPHSDTILPHVILGDEAFPLLPNLLKPYPSRTATSCTDQTAFNYRLSRARRVSENGFGIMCRHFPIFYQPINLKIETTQNLVVSACILHNLLRENNVLIQQNENNDDDIGHNLDPIQNVNNQEDVDVVSQGSTVRDEFKMYFTRNHILPWQNDVLPFH